MEFILTGVLIWFGFLAIGAWALITLLPLIIGIGVVWFICWIIHKMVSGKVK